MKKSRIRCLLLLIISVFFIIISTIAQDSPDNGIPPEIMQSGDSWSLPNQNYANTRVTTTSAINLTNVNELDVTWTFPTSEQNSSTAFATSPIVSNGIVYLQDLASNVYALDFVTGEIIWETQYNNTVTSPNGVGIGYGKVFVASSADSFVALNIETGEEVWSHSTNSNSTGAIQPVVYDEQVYFASQAIVVNTDESLTLEYPSGVSGHIYALNQADGSLNWQFQVVEEGFWGNPNVNSGGGLWFPPAIDTTTGMSFWGTGNPAPAPGTAEFPNAESREEPNLFTNSAIVLHEDDGTLEWYSHLNPDDLFNLGVQLSPILATVVIDGEEQHITIVSGKFGEIIALNRTTGETIWRTAVGVHQNDDVTDIPDGETITVYPGVFGGVLTPMAYIDGVIYASVLNLPTTYSPTGDIQETARGTGTSEIVALNVITGEIYWNHVINAEIYAGTTVVNDLIFTADYQGLVYALNRFTGEEVWTWQAPAGITAFPAVVNDTILFPAGVGESPQLIALRLSAGVGPSEVRTEPETTQIVEVTATSTPADEVTAESAEATDTPTASDDSDQNQPVGTDVDAILTKLDNIEGDASRGNTLFNGSTNTRLDETINCVSCHEGGTFGPDTSNLWTRIQNQRLSLDTFSDYTAEEYAVESIVQPDAYVVSGYDAGVMPGNFGELMTTQDLADLVAYLKTLTDG